MTIRNEIGDDLEKILREYPTLVKYGKPLIITDAEKILKLIHEKNLKATGLIEVKLRKEIRPLSGLFIANEYEILLLSFHKSVNSVVYVFSNNFEAFYNDMRALDNTRRPGLYALYTDYQGPQLKEVTLQVEDIPILNNNVENEVTERIDSFFSRPELYKKYNIIHKSGVMLHGPPGNGKTSLIKNIIQKYNDAYSFIIDSGTYIDWALIEFIRENFGKEKKILVFEDIDRMGDSNRSILLNFMDGTTSIGNAFFIATTNDISKLDVAVFNRPGRFDAYYYMSCPDEETRKKILTRHFPELSVLEIKKVAGETEGFSGAYLKEMFIAHKIRGIPLDKVIKALSLQSKRLQGMALQESEFSQELTYTG